MFSSYFQLFFDYPTVEKINISPVLNQHFERCEANTNQIWKLQII
jgi:hypothetical protein